MHKALKYLLVLVNDELASKSIFEDHYVGYDEDIDSFHVFVSINGVPYEKSIPGFDRDAASMSMTVDDLEKTACVLKSFADDELKKIIYSN